MVWCARESADFRPGDSYAMQLFEPYGWIHWGGKTWHTVTGYELGAPLAPVLKSQVPLTAAFAASSCDVAPLAEDPAPIEKLRQVSLPDELEPHPPAQHPSAPRPLTSGDSSALDSDHKRDGDRADTQQALDNTRWDAQHMLDNARWDTRHTLENARWDSYLALKRAREDTARAADMAMMQTVHGAYLAVAQSSLDRAVQRATYVATAAGAIGTLYTAILAARYTVHHQAPARSILPAFFIGAAVAFSTWYMAFLRGHTRNQQLLLSGTGGSVAETRLLDFMEWTFSGVLARAWSLRVSVISLALGLALLPVGLVQLSSGSVQLIGFAALAVLILWFLGELGVALWPREFNNSRPSKPPRLAPKAPTLPPAPTGGFVPTGPRSYGLDVAPPTAPKGADRVDPPPPPAAAGGPPPVAAE
jgi:hypothetical protein